MRSRSHGTSGLRGWRCFPPQLLDDTSGPPSAREPRTTVETVISSQTLPRLIMSALRRAFTVILLLGGFLATGAQTPAPAPAACPSKSNTSCVECLQNVRCLWCAATEQCLDYPLKTILPPRRVCPLIDARWGVCWVNFQILIITISVLAGIVFIAFLICCCCCCKCERVGKRREDAKVERQNRARNSRQRARRMEMQLRHDEIRQKYGLSKDNPYCRMNEK